MEEEKTLLQQIRDKEEAFSEKIGRVKQETDAQITEAERERERAIHQAGIAGKNSAEEQLRREQQKTEIEIQRMKKVAESETGAAVKRGERNLPHAVDKIIGYVTRE